MKIPFGEASRDKNLSLKKKKKKAFSSAIVKQFGMQLVRKQENVQIFFLFFKLTKGNLVYALCSPSISKSKSECFSGQGRKSKGHKDVFFVSRAQACSPDPDAPGSGWGPSIRCC